MIAHSPWHQLLIYNLQVTLIEKQHGTVEGGLQKSHLFVFGPMLDTFPIVHMKILRGREVTQFA